MVSLLSLTLMLAAQNFKSHGSGFDAYTSCYRTSRQRPDLPCDFALQNWCGIPGSSYPWHAVRRFVHENQGLMKRMYGDERHISVLQAELDNNEIEYFFDAKDKDDVRQRYSKKMTSTLLHKKERKLSKIEKTKKAIAHLGGDNIMGKNNFHNLGNLKNSYSDLSKSTPLLTLKPQTTKVAESSSVTPTEPSPLTTTSTPQTTAPTVTTQPSGSNSKNDTIFGSEKTVPSQIEVSQSTIPSDTTLTSNEAPTETTEIPIPTTDSDSDVEVTTEELGYVDEAGYAEQEVYDDSVEEAEADEEEGEESSENSEDVPPKSPPILRLKGINACPVKEEVVAPFWANNTRGEVLALLNLYPFEQYVHWEKCSYEHKQMFCREGCRCEQQYRLHRLLAYDPNNECRGIFSDWFRFPSCCVCKCYDVPMELRLTSRSPRSPTLSKMEPGPT